MDPFSLVYGVHADMYLSSVQASRVSTAKQHLKNRGPSSMTPTLPRLELDSHGIDNVGDCHSPIGSCLEKLGGSGR